MKVEEKPANFNPDSIHPNWTSDVLLTLKKLKRLEEDPNNTVVDFRLLVGIPADPGFA